MINNLIHLKNTIVGHMSQWYGIMSNGASMNFDTLAETKELLEGHIEQFECYLLEYDGNDRCKIIVTDICVALLSYQNLYHANISQIELDLNSDDNSVRNCAKLKKEISDIIDFKWFDEVRRSYPSLGKRLGIVYEPAEEADRDEAADNILNYFQSRQDFKELQPAELFYRLQQIFAKHPTKGAMLGKFLDVLEVMGFIQRNVRGLTSRIYEELKMKCQRQAVKRFGKGLCRISQVNLSDKEFDILQNELFRDLLITEKQ